MTKSAKKKSFVTLVLPSIPRPMSQTFVTIGSVKGMILPILTIPFKVIGAYFGNFLGIYFTYVGPIHLDIWDMFGIKLCKYWGPQKRTDDFENQNFVGDPNTLPFLCFLRKQMSGTLVGPPVR